MKRSGNQNRSDAQAKWKSAMSCGKDQDGLYTNCNGEFLLSASFCKTLTYLDLELPVRRWYLSRDAGHL